MTTGRLLEMGIQTDGTNLDVFKGGAQITVNGPLFKRVVVTTKTAASNVTYTAAELIGGLIVRNPSGGSRTDTTPSAALLAKAIRNLKVGSSFTFAIRNVATAAETITLAAGANVTLAAGNTNVVAQGNTRTFMVVCTEIGSVPKFTVYSLGASAH